MEKCGSDFSEAHLPLDTLADMVELLRWQSRMSVLYRDISFGNIVI